MTTEWVRELEIIHKRYKGESISFPVYTWVLYHDDELVAIHREVPGFFQLTDGGRFYIGVYKINYYGGEDFFETRRAFKDFFIAILYKYT